MTLGSKAFVGQKRFAVFRGKDDVDINLSKRLRHDFLPPGRMTVRVHWTTRRGRGQGGSWIGEATICATPFGEGGNGTRPFPGVRYRDPGLLNATPSGVLRPLSYSSNRGGQLGEKFVERKRTPMPIPPRTPRQSRNIPEGAREARSGQPPIGPGQVPAIMLKWRVWQWLRRR